MIIDVRFNETNQAFNANFGETYRVSDGGYERGLEDGKQTEWNAFWDEYQQYGNRKDYGNAFCRYNFTDKNFKPKYDIVPDNYGAQMFQDCPHITNLKKLLEDAGVKLDLSKCGSLLQMFQGSENMTYLPVIDGSVATSYNYTFYGTKALKEIDKFIVNEKGTFNNTFAGSRVVEKIIFEGTIGNDLSLKDSVLLNHESLMSVINCLKDFSGSGTTHTLTLGATNLAKLTDAEKAIATQKGWTLA